MVQILYTANCFISGPSNRETNGGKETIGDGLKPLEEIEDFLQFFSVVKMKQMDEIGDFWHSFSIKGVKIKTNVNF